MSPGGGDVGAVEDVASTTGGEWRVTTQNHRGQHKVGVEVER